MSNPAVIQLASTYIGDTEVRIEDNWAESIHLHFGLLRIDLTVEEFLYIADQMELAANEIIQAENFDIRNFDPLFLNYYSKTLSDLESVTLDRVRLGDILILKNVKLPFYRDLTHSRDYKALHGDTSDLDAYASQINLLGQTNLDRLNKMLESIKENGYPHNDEYIIMRNNQNVILDGQHRASCMMYLYGPDHIVPIMRFHYKNNKYNVTDWHPWIKVLCRKFINILKRISRRMLGTGQIDV